MASDDVLLGESRALEHVRTGVENAARSHAKVLITGETGVGKEIVARQIHRRSARRHEAFVPVNCTGIPETLLASELFGHTRGSFTGACTDRLGLFRRAHRGTLFLDELGEMSLAMQAILLRFTETGEVQCVGADAAAPRSDVRLITATNRNLRTQIAAGAFREDLYYRLNVICIEIPPLRDRAGDILLLARHFLKTASTAYGLPCARLSADAEQVLLEYHWPGNVRELRNVTERITLLATAGETITADDLPKEIRLPGADPATAATASPDEPPTTSEAAHRLWDQLRAGGDFWTVVQAPFRKRQITKADLEVLIDRGLTETRGSYRALVTLFNLAPGEYKRFHAFLYQHSCNLPVMRYRTVGRQLKACLPERPLRRLRRAG